MAGRHLVDVVEGVEDAEDVDAGRGGLVDERLRHLFRVGRVADRVAAAQQHLQVDVRQRLAQRRQPVPRVLAEEAQGDVVGRPAPGLDGQQLRAAAAVTAGPAATRSRVRTRVASSDWCASRNVVSVTATAVCARRAFGEAFRAELQEPLAGPRRGPQVASTAGSLSAGSEWTVSSPLGLLTVTSASQVSSLVPRSAETRAFSSSGPFVDEGGGHVAGDEVGIVQDGLQEGDVGGHAADAEFGEGAAGTGDGGRVVAAAAGQLDQHGVEVRADLGARVDGAAVEPHAGAAGRAVAGDLADVGPEAVGRILRGDAALQRSAPELDGVLRQAQVRERFA